MQNRYAGDVGDFVKLGLLRALSPGLKLGVAWYLYPDEAHNDDGKHFAYLRRPDVWRSVDPELFDRLREVVGGQRSVAALERSGILNADFANELMSMATEHHSRRSQARCTWFANTLDALAGCDLVFADPDNGLTDDSPTRRTSRKFGKQLPLHECLALAAGRSAIIYHHNTRFAGGHDMEVDHWRKQLGRGTIAVRANAYSCRTFFIVNPTAVLMRRAEFFCDKWSNHKVRLHA